MEKIVLLIYYKIVMEVWFCDHHEKTVIDISYLFDIVFCKQKKEEEKIINLIHQCRRIVSICENCTNNENLW